MLGAFKGPTSAAPRAETTLAPGEAAETGKDVEMASGSKRTKADFWLFESIFL